MLHILDDFRFHLILRVEVELCSTDEKLDILDVLIFLENFAIYQQRYILDIFYFYFILFIHVVGMKKNHNGHEILLRQFIDQLYHNDQSGVYEIRHY